jgi:hypothetical protein
MPMKGGVFSAQKSCMCAPQVSGLAKSLQEKQRELDAGLRAQKQLPQPPPRATLPKQALLLDDEALLTEPLRVGNKRAREAHPMEEALLPLEQAAQVAGRVGRPDGSDGALFPGIDTSTPAGCRLYPSLVFVHVTRLPHVPSGGSACCGSGGHACGAKRCTH